MAAAAGLSVKTVRYYSDSGLLPVAERSSGGHRRYGAEALERLRLIRQLRALDTPIATITQVVSGERSLADVVDAEFAAVQNQLAELRWRQATLQSLSDCGPEERLRRLHIVSRVQRLPEARHTLSELWYRTLPKAMPKHWLDRMVAMLSPAPPDHPSPESVLAYAELHLLTVTPSFTQWTHDHRQEIRDAPSFYAQVDEAAQQTVAALTQGLAPQPGDAVNAFVSAHARAHGEADTPAFRARLHTLVSQSSGYDPRLERYWSLVGTATDGQSFNMVTAHRWLSDALAASLRPDDRWRTLPPPASTTSSGS
ncbi:MerR family transcriptional regulator [Streptomyces sp. NPDC004533]|uniref:MerR family transcriptional regulator n=1 Tax=Streptomyces sp. NPDC004533 TaxID=3154278 RepID=UPI0033A5AFEA